MTTKNTTRCTTVGLFATREAADRAVEELRQSGYRDEQIGLISKDSSGKAVKRDGSGSADTNASEGAAVGAAVGAAGGAAVGAAMLTGVIPVVGPIIALGALGTVLATTAAGAAAVGLAGALIGWGIPEDEAKYYEGRVMAGQHLVTVEGRPDHDTRAVFSRHGGYERQTDPSYSSTTAI
jgi:hypothetical protein